MSRRYAQGSMPWSSQLAISETKVVFHSAPASLPTKVQFFRLCRALHNRKNFLFVGHEEGGHNLAILQTVCSTCLLHGINPYEYIRDVAVRVRFHPNAKLDELLPMNWKPPPGSDPPAADPGTG